MSYYTDFETLEEAAKQDAGNWQKWESFAWFNDEIEDPENWAIVYTHHRDSGLLDRSNAAIIARELHPFLGVDVHREDHNHWACGWIKGYSIRVYRRGQITDAYKAYHELSVAMDNYPILDEDHYCDLETEATWNNVVNAVKWFAKDYDTPADVVDHVYNWLMDNNPNCLENTDDQGGYPGDDDLREAFEALGYFRNSV